MTAGHREAILDQFTRQAVPFSTSPTIRDEQALSLLVEACGAGPTDTVLDVACGGGNVVCASNSWPHREPIADCIAACPRGSPRRPPAPPAES